MLEYESQLVILIIFVLNNYNEFLFNYYKCVGVCDNEYDVCDDKQIVVGDDVCMDAFAYDAVLGHVESLSQSVIKILTLHRVKKIFFSFYHHKEEIHSFPTMYNTWGFIGWKWAKKIIFSKKMV